MSDETENGGEDESAEDEEEGGRWDWTTNGGCAICDAMEGSYEEEPQRPHERCDCEITFVAANEGEERTPRCVNPEIEVELLYVGGADDNDPSSPVFTAVYHFSVTCRDDSTFETEVEVDLDSQDVVNDFELAYEAGLSDALDEVEDEAYAICPECEDPLIS